MLPKIEVLKNEARIRLDRLAEIRDKDISKLARPALESMRDEMQHLLNELETINKDIEDEKRAMSVDNSFRNADSGVIPVAKTLPLNDPMDRRSAMIYKNDEFYLPAESRNDHRSIAIMENRVSNNIAEVRAASGSFKGSTFADFLTSVRRAETPGAGPVDGRLYESRAASGLNESVGSEGGFLVPNDFATEIFRNIMDVGAVSSRCRSMAISGNTLTVPAIDESSRATGSRFGGIRGYWTAEAATATPTKPAFRQVTLSLKKLMCLGYLTDELLEDSPSAGAIIAQGFIDELAFLLDDAIINGDGVGKPLGILQSPCLVTQAAENAQGSKTILFENIQKMWMRLPAPSRKNAVWFINQDVEQQLYSMSLIVGTGGISVWMPAGGASVGGYSTLFGRPVIPIEQAATLGTTGDIILADMSQYLLAVKSGGTKLDVSMHVRFSFGESCYRAHVRIDGSPLWQTTLTPYKGANALSPFVTLATRA
jgi:HK97 family phage major capsid protein